MDSDLDNSLNYDGNSDIMYDEEGDEGSELRLNADADIDHEHDNDNGDEIGDNTTGDDNDQELQNIKARVREMEEEAEKLKQLQSEAEQQMNVGFGMSPSATGTMSLEEKMEVDARSVYVGNVDYGATAEELEAHFHGSGSINRVTILCNKFDGHPKGFAYIEFADKESVNASLAFDESLFRGRLIKVMPKRTNRPGLSVRPPRGGRGGGGFRPPYRGRGSFRGGYGRFPRRGYRGRGTFYSPY